MPKRTRKHVVRKTVLRLPDLDHAKTSVLNSLSSLRSRRNYKFAMEQFIDWYCSEPRLALNRTVVLRFRLHLESLGLAAGTINQRLAAVRRLAYEAADAGLLSRSCARRLELDHLAPHDLRRTCAKLCHVNGGELEQIQARGLDFQAGHSDSLRSGDPDVDTCRVIAKRKDY
jgi:hypothetical protein